MIIPDPYELTPVEEVDGLDLARFEYVDAYSDLDGYQYEKTYRETVGEVRLHPRYEAKAYRWFKQSGIAGKTLLWIVGGEIGVR